MRSTLDRWPVHHRADMDRETHTLTITPTASLKLPLNLTHTSLDCGRKPENLERTHSGRATACWYFQFNKKKRKETIKQWYKVCYTADCQSYTYSGLFEVQNGGQRISTGRSKGSKPRGSPDRRWCVGGHLLVQTQLLQGRKTLAQHQHCRTHRASLLTNEICDRKKKKKSAAFVKIN